MEPYIDIISNTLMITAFVMVMMLLIEFVNVQTRGKWSVLFRKSKWAQVLAAGLLGAIPGCLGAYAVVSLYIHNIFNFAALTTAMIATFGDEAFIMFAVMPGTALQVLLYTILIAIITGLIMNIFIKNKNSLVNQEHHMHLHNEAAHGCLTKKENILEQLKNISFQRAILLSGLILVLFGVITGVLSHEHAPLQHGDHHHHVHEEVDWISVTFFIITIFALFLTLVASDNFLEKHLWEHVIKKHILKILFWTLGALLIIHFIVDYLHFENWMRDNHLIILVMAVLIGIIPASGPHILFISLYMAGQVPFSILLASSVVQDGHGALPLFAESKKSFILVKGVNLFIGLVVGLLGYFFNW